MQNDDKRIFIGTSEQRLLMLDMLLHVDRICRDYGIKYSLIGGSLIGAIRHKGFIPWDDDLDIILTKNNYYKLKSILDSEIGNYQTLKFGKGGERFSFVKLVDVRTRAREFIQQKDDPNYGVYIDIFCYCPVSEDSRTRQKQFSRLKTLMKFITREKANRKDRTWSQNAKQFVKNTISEIIGYRIIDNMFMRILNRYDDSRYLVSNWPVYKYEQEIQLKVNTKDYINAEFEGHRVMIFKNYDEILRTTFGDYMQLPPESERKPKHNMSAWWKDGHQNDAKILKARLEKANKDGKIKR